MKSPECGSKLFGDFFIRDFQDVRQYHKYDIILFIGSGSMKALSENSKGEKIFQLIISGKCKRRRK